MGHLINHSKSLKNIKPVLTFEQGETNNNFLAIRQIAKDEELLEWVFINQGFGSTEGLKPFCL